VLLDATLEEVSALLGGRVRPPFQRTVHNLDAGQDLTRRQVDHGTSSRSASGTNLEGAPRRSGCMT
jgi:hypothetical protein